MNRLVIAWIAVGGACGGKATPQPATPSNQAAPATAVVDDKAACANRADAYGPFSLTKEQAAARYGQSATKFTDAPTTKDKAIEVCGIPASVTWLKDMACDTGEAAKARGRVGSVGRGGRCGAIIDLYEMECPEAVYKVFIDVYQCGPGENFM